MTGLQRILLEIRKIVTPCRFLPSSFDAVIIMILPSLFLLCLLTGCVSGKVKSEGLVSTYQEMLVARGPQERIGVTEGQEPISPAPDPRLPDLEAIKDVTGRTRIDLTIENALVRALANSPEITEVSFEPSISKQSIAVAASEFDVTAFGQVGYDKKDSPSNNISESGRSDSSLWEAGIKQKGITGVEWLLSYSMRRTVDPSISRIFSTSYEPVLTFKLKQPLLRDAWPDINLAGVDISKLNYRIALASFRQKTEDVSAQVISLYWILLQARRDVEIQQFLLDKTVETLRTLEDRRNIDATLGDVKQAEAALKSREAALFDAKKALSDVQDALVRLLADHQMKLTDNLEIVPTTAPDTIESILDQSALLSLALDNNPEIIQAKLEAEVADINVKVSKRQQMPRLDFVTSAQLQGLSDDQREARRMVSKSDYESYSLGITLEYPIGNREKKAEFRQRKLRHLKAISRLQNVSDQVISLVKERIRLAETAFHQIQTQKEAVEAAKVYLQVLEDIETVRKKMTPEFLLAKIQAQGSLAIAQRSEIKAVVDYNIALTRLAQATGRVLDMRSVQSAVPIITSGKMPKFIPPVDRIETDKPMQGEPTKSEPQPKITEETEKLTEQEKTPNLKQPAATDETTGI